MFEDAFNRSGRDGVAFDPRLEQFVPEASAVGKSQSNGKAENTVQRLEDMLRTYKSALETNIDSRIPTDHPIIHWMVEHGAAVYNSHVCNDDGATPYESLHGQRSRGTLAECWQQVVDYVPERLRSKQNLRFRVGTFLENSSQLPPATLSGQDLWCES